MEGYPDSGCGDLTSAFDYTAADPAPFAAMPDPHADAIRAAAIHKQLSPPALVGMSPSWQEPGIRRSRPLPYALTVREAIVDGAIHFRFAAEGEQAEGKQAAVFHVPDRTDLAQAPRRFIVEPAYALDGGR